MSLFSRVLQQRRFDVLAAAAAGFFSESKGM